MKWTSWKWSWLKQTEDLVGQIEKEGENSSYSYKISSYVGMHIWCGFWVFVIVVHYFFVQNWELLNKYFNTKKHPQPMCVIFLVTAHQASNSSALNMDLHRPLTFDCGFIIDTFFFSWTPSIMVFAATIFSYSAACPEPLWRYQAPNCVSQDKKSPLIITYAPYWLWSPKTPWLIHWVWGSNNDLGTSSTFETQQDKSCI